MPYLLFLLSVLTTLVLTLSLNSTGSASAVRRVVGKVNVLLGLQSHHERWHVDNLLADSNVSLVDQHSGVVDRSGQTQLEHLGLQSSLQKVLGLQGQHVIQLHLVLGQHTNLHQSSDQGVTLEQSLGVLLVSGQKVTGGSSDLGQLELNSVDLSLVLQAEFTSQLQLAVQTGRLVGLLGHRVGLGVSSRSAWS